jgi:heme/copper-type cytochrome/quinol oxidase subunit 3
VAFSISFQLTARIARSNCAVRAGCFRTRVYAPNRLLRAREGYYNDLMSGELFFYGAAVAVFFYAAAFFAGREPGAQAAKPAGEDSEISPDFTPQAVLGALFLAVAATLAGWAAFAAESGNYAGCVVFFAAVAALALAYAAKLGIFDGSAQ